MAYSTRVLGVKDLENALQRVARMVPSGDVSEALKRGADVIVEEAQRNVWREGLYDKGTLHDSIHSVKINQWQSNVAVDAVHGAVHEFGLPKGGKGIWSATAKQIRFFWFKWLETGETMWKALALKKGYRIPPRPYLTPAIKDKKDQAMEAAGNYLWECLIKKLQR